jgi:hypothetical protein
MPALIRFPTRLFMNKRQRHILAQQIGQVLRHRRRVISISLASALLEMDRAHLERLEREGLFPHRVVRPDGSGGYDLADVYHWLRDY